VVGGVETASGVNDVADKLDDDAVAGAEVDLRLCLRVTQTHQLM